MTWATTELCQDSDLRGFESTVMQWTSPEGSAKKWRDQAKTLIAEKLRHGLQEYETSIDADDVLDLIDNPEVLNTIACYYTLYLLANDKMTHPNDYYAAKAAHYLHMFNSEWANALSDVHYDLDESGDIGDSERHMLKTGIRLERGV